MQWFAPSYYPDFSCVAGACRHNCCIGWEIDIDAETLALYNTVDGPLGRRLKSDISMEEPPHFILSEDNRCPFLNSENLCDLILELGEDALCQICADHPRFRNDWSDRTEVGLGLCCEAAARLILTGDGPVALIPLWDDGTAASLPPEEASLRALRDEALALLQAGSVPLSVRETQLLAHCGARLPDRTLSQWADTLLSLERLDPAWTPLLERLRRCGGEPPAPSLPDTVWERLLVYFVYRHFPAALEDGIVESKAAFAVLSTRVIRALCALEQRRAGQLTLDGAVEICRMYSSEIEYSEENLSAMFKLLQ